MLHDARLLTRLGSGTLTLDILRGTCRHNKRWIPPLVILGVLRSRLTAALGDLAIPMESISDAALEVRFELHEQSDLKKKETVWVGGEAGFVGCRMEIRAQLSMGEETSTVSLTAFQEWTREWGER